LRVDDEEVERILKKADLRFCFVDRMNSIDYPNSSLIVSDARSMLGGHRSHVLELDSTLKTILGSNQLSMD
jgi:hypothetical protein